MKKGPGITLGLFHFQEIRMTTTVVIKANHGWPVRVQQKDPKTGEDINQEIIVEPNTEMTYVVHSGADLLIHEIQPDERTQEAAPVEQDEPAAE